MCVNCLVGAQCVNCLIIAPAGAILGYSVTILDASGAQVSATSSSTEQFVVDSLMCCSNYSYQVAARTSAGEGTPSEALRFMTYGKNTANRITFGKSRAKQCGNVSP